jgi:two-component sensor histidine kinase
LAERAQHFGRFYPMESLLKFLPPRPQPILVRYGVSAVMVLVFFAFHLGAGPAAGEYGFILFIPPILAAAVLFDRGSGFFATGLSAALIAALLNWRAEPVNHVAALTLFVCVSLFVVVVGEGMRKALERSAAARDDLELLMDEQGHRVKNDLAIASALIALQARAQKEPTVRAALESAVARVHVLAKGYDHLRVTERDQATDMPQYLGEVCWKLGEGLRGVRPIAVEVDADRVETRSQTATRIGLIVNELVTNALKHAFPDERGGTVYVRLRRNGDELTLSVEDDGVGCPDAPTEGLGSRIVRLLVQQMHGRMTREPAQPGCRVMIVIPAAA